MKTLRHLSLLILFCCAFTSSKAQWVTIPDPLFASWIDSKHPGCMNGNQMDTTCPGIVNDTSIVYKYQNIYDFTGVQYFDNLLTLECTQNRLTILPELPPKLKKLNVAINQIDSFPSSLPPYLEILNIYSNKVTKLPPIPYNYPLTFIDVSNNRLDSLPPLPPFVNWLACDVNRLTTLPPLPSTLELFGCGVNQLTTLPALPANLIYLFCGDNSLASIPPLPTTLEALRCDNNQLASLPPLPRYLYNLYCDSNRLTSLPDLPYYLRDLRCERNPYLHCLPNLPSSLRTLSFDSLNISCVPNYVNVTTSTPRLSNVPLCEPGNASGCISGWNISGKVFKDIDNNCYQMPGEDNVAFVKVKLLQNNTVVQQMYTGAYGVYSFLADTGANKLTVDTTGLPFTLFCPASQFDSVTVNTNSLIQDRDFVLQCKPGYDVAVWNIVSANQVRPAAFMPVQIQAGDNAQQWAQRCNTNNLPGQLVTTITGPARYISPVQGALTPTTIAGNVLTYTISDWSAVNPLKDFDIIMQCDTFAQANQQICLDIKVTPAAGDNDSSNNHLTQCFAIVNSYDPNDKQVSPIGVINNTAQWLTYTIRFQNTGTAPAININILDTLDPALDASSFQLLAYSHRPVVNIYNTEHRARFTFPTINLADSVNNEPESHGYIQYRVKTLPGLNCGTQIGNAAHIYFDYNPPVATNAAINTIYMRSVAASQNTICIGETYNWRNRSLTATGTYADTLQNVYLCDSIISLRLDVVSAFEEYQNATLCHGETYNWRNRSLSAQGTYADTLQTATACDSIITLQLQVLPAIEQTESATLCHGETYNWHNQSLTAAGAYTDTLQASSTCDSIITLQLQVLPAITQNQSATTCAGEPFNFNGRALTAAGVYTDTLQASSTCDSIITLQLQVLPAITQSQSGTTCAGEPFNFNGRALTAAGVYTDTLQASTSCDSIVTLQLQVLPSYSQSESATVCNGETFNWRNLALTTAGNYADTLQASSSCDSIITLQLQVLQGAEVTESASICDGETYTWRNRNLTARDTYTDTLQTTAGCDSVLILNLEVYTGYSAVVDTSILSGTSLVLPSGTTVTAAGNYTDTLQSIFGCDSIIITRLSVISGIENIASTATMQLYPNPATDMVIINLSSNLTGGTLTLSDVTGRSLNTISLTANHNQLNTGALSSGVYLVTAEKGGVRVVQRLVVSK